MISIAVLAHNEAEGIAACLASILGQEDLRPDDRIAVLENGSTDGTAAIVEGIAAREPRVRLVRLPLGDKANAWDAHVFGDGIFGGEAGQGTDLCVFIDGDVTMRPGSLAALREALAAHPDALAAAALPHGGRTAMAWRARILAEHGLPGNLYALRGSTVERLREGSWWLPVGFIGDDTFLMWLLRRRLDPSLAPDRGAIVPAQGAGFDYASLPAMTLSGLRGLYRRQRTYGMRDIQTKLLVDHLLADPSHRPPREIAELYPRARPMDALLGPFGRLAPVKLRKALFLATWARTRRVRVRREAAWFEG